MFRVRDALGAVYPVHRLDRGTSGVLVFARRGGGGHAVKGLNRVRWRSDISPSCVGSRPNPERSTTRSQERTGPRVPAVTHFTMVTRSPVDRCSLVLAIPETGRGHQGRRHLRHLGHPLVGDVNYGSGEINRHYRAAYDLRRLALHAHAIAFNHPSLARVAITAPMPDDLGLALGALGLPRTPCSARDRGGVGMVVAWNARAGAGHYPRAADARGALRAAQRFLSWAIVGGGATRGREVAWCQVTDGELTRRSTPAALLSERLAVAGVPEAVGLSDQLRRRPLRPARRHRGGARGPLRGHRRARELACAPGTRPARRAPSGHDQPALRALSRPLSERAMVEATALCAEARAVAIVESGALSLRSGLRGVGHGHRLPGDRGARGREPLAFVGKHTDAGHLIGQVVLSAVTTGVRAWLAETRAELSACPCSSAWRLTPTMLAVAIAVRLLFGDPPNAAHPVAWMGRLATALVRRAPAIGARTTARRGRRSIVLGLCGASVGTLAVLALATAATPTLGFWLGAAVLTCMFAIKGLGAAGRVVRDALADRRPERRAARPVRPLQPRRLDLDEAQLAAATIESLAENLSDSFVAPLLAYALFGLPGAVVYRAVNTLDAMIGYRGRYEYLGKAAARLRRSAEPDPRAAHRGPPPARGRA